MGKSAYDWDVAKRTISAATLIKVGQHLRMLRVALGHNQAQWADALGISAPMLNKWEAGTRQPNIDVLIRICESTRCTLDFIFRGRLGRDVDQELRERLASLYGGDLVLLFSPAAAPQPPDPSAAPSDAAHKPRKRPAPRKSSHRASTRRTPPSPH